jgi:hypothetical protein
MSQGDIMEKRLRLAAGALAALVGFGSAAQAATVLTFEGLGDQAPIGNFYNGGAGGNFGVQFGPDSLAIIEQSAGGTGNFTNPPSGVTVAFFLTGPGDVMNVAGGFTTGFSFFYADQVGFTGSVTVWSGLDGTGTQLASLSLPPTPDPYNVWVPMGVSFAGTAESAVFGGSANFIGFDNITLGSAIPGGVPEPSTWAMMLIGFVGLGFAFRQSRRNVSMA